MYSSLKIRTTRKTFIDTMYSSLNTGTEIEVLIWKNLDIGEPYKSPSFDTFLGKRK
jgi:hypothetical protein